MIFTSRGITIPKKVVRVTITGSGSASGCYATINGTKYYGAASGIEVQPGDEVTFGVYGYNGVNVGYVNIDDTRVLTVNTNATKTYGWAVPEGIESITVAMTYTSYYGRIVVTTQ